MWLRTVIWGFSFVSQTLEKAVFAHFMVENVKQWSSAEWVADIALAKTSRIDAFALNMRSDDSSVDQSLKHAFKAAQCTNFQLFFSFDYAGGGPWKNDRVQALIKQYQNHTAYYKYDGRALVSTFEGSQNAADWHTIKTATNCFFIPDWSSIGAKAALEFGVADGLFSWGAWPTGPNDMTTDDDVYYQRALTDVDNGKPYMMPISPWFFTNLPGYGKNWLWRGDDLWYDRWQQVLSLEPQFVQIISWNDYGESHYIGPLHDEEYNAFSIGKAPFNYVQDMPHDGWRSSLPNLIEMYKGGQSKVTQEGIIAWYRLAPKDACPDGGTTGNVASHGQSVFEASEIVQDKIFFFAMLRSPADIIITVGGVELNASWRNVSTDGEGLYYGNVPYNGSTGDVTVMLSRNGSSILVLNGKFITTCSDGIQNWNAWVGSQLEPCSDCADQVGAICLEGTASSVRSNSCLQSCLWSLMALTSLMLWFG